MWSSSAPCWQKTDVIHRDYSEVFWVKRYWKEVTTSPLGQEHLLSAFHLLHSYHIPHAQPPRTPRCHGETGCIHKQTRNWTTGQILDFKMHFSQARQGRGGLVSRREAVQQGQSSWKATRPFPKYRCLLRQREASCFQTSPLAQHNWDPTPGTIRCWIALDLLCIRFYPGMLQIRVRGGAESRREA